jgi:hypothetical protein
VRLGGLPLLILLALAPPLAGCVTTQQASRSRPAVTAEQLMGQDSQAVLVALGQPRRVRKEAPAEVWQYNAGSCVVDLFLYPDGGKQKVMHLEARDVIHGKTIDATSCLAKMPGVATS